MAENIEKQRWYPGHPWVGVGAVVVRDGELLMVRRGKEPYKGMWSIPGGAVELGETLFQTAERETLEETSIRIKAESVLDGVDEIIQDENGRVKYHFIDVDVLARYVGGEPEARSDAGDCRWVTIKEIKKINMPVNLREMLQKNRII
jgi:8-oxo-dGTP diphosphatase